MQESRPDLMSKLHAPNHWTYTVRKLAIYGRHGVPEYWIVDPDRDRIEVFVLEGGALVRRALHESGEVRSLVALPGFAAPLDEIFSRSL
jgi:Uma2 family endonuclease